MSAFVADASVVLAWYHEEDYSEAAARLADAAATFHAPEILAAEVTNGLWKWMRSGILQPDDAEWLVYAFRRFPFEWHSLEPLVDPALHLAVNHDHPVYDCLYLALALREHCQLVTGDRRFYNKVAPTYPETMLWIEDVPSP